MDRTRVGGVRCVFPLLLTAFPIGCASTYQPTQPEIGIAATTRPVSTEGLLSPRPVMSVETMSPIPIDWKAEPLKHSAERDHQIWLSPTGSTAYGVIRFHNLLLPVAPNRMVLDKFLESMKKSEGEATLLSVQDDPKVGGLRFVAEGGVHRIRATMVKRGTGGWVVYAGTRRDQPIIEAELQLAEAGREHTSLGIPQAARGAGGSPELPPAGTDQPPVSTSPR